MINYIYPYLRTIQTVLPKNDYVTIITTLEPFLGDEDLPYYVRQMRREDLSQIAGIDREAFPTQWPPANYRRELENRLAHYIVACDDGKKVELSEVEVPHNNDFSRLVAKIKRLFYHNRFQGNDLLSLSTEYVIGFAGIWVMVDEAHITNIAMRESYRRQGVGELLLLSIIDMAIKLSAHYITLEVRASNTAAQSLYLKHGFSQTGLRRGYYTDNREDAILMTTENTTSATFQAHLQQLKQAHSSKWGRINDQIAH
jgi:ribosomal-protein-alanine N-acetyltransferase